MTKVQLQVDGKRCIMDNGILHIIWKEDASVESLQKNGFELVKELAGTSTDGNAKRTCYVDYHAEGKFHRLKVSRLEIIENTEDIAHIAYIDTEGMLYLEYHILLKRAESGFYSYLVVKSNVDAPISLSELRTVYRFGNTIFDHGCNSERIGLQPSHKYMEQYECIQDETYRLPDVDVYTNGDIYSKYDYASYFSRNPAWGQYGNGYGMFVIPSSTEYYPGGPLKQELLVHYDGIVLNYFTGSHFGTGNLMVQTDFEKFYGPFFVYINSEEDIKEASLYEDAIQRSYEESKKWPYSFISDPLYPLERSNVKGILEFSDGSPCSNTTIILAKPGGNVERQSHSYIYHTTTNSKGEYELDHVRYDNYSLYAYHTGGSITNELIVDSIHITESSVHLPSYTYPLLNRTSIWQIGSSTRTSKGFCNAGELRNYKWQELSPKDFTYTIGENQSSDWYYVQSKLGTWNINFNIDEHTLKINRNKSYYFTLALSGISKGFMTDKAEPYIQIKLNDELIKESTLLNDAAAYRSATLSGRYRRIEVVIPSHLIVSGMNQFSIVNYNAMLMYDTLLLEVENDA